MNNVVPRPRIIQGMVTRQPPPMSPEEQERRNIMHSMQHLINSHEFYNKFPYHVVMKCVMQRVSRISSDLPRFRKFMEEELPFPTADLIQYIQDAAAPQKPRTVDNQRIALRVATLRQHLKMLENVYNQMNAHINNLTTSMATESEPEKQAQTKAQIEKLQDKANKVKRLGSFVHGAADPTHFANPKFVDMVTAAEHGIDTIRATLSKQQSARLQKKCFCCGQQPKYHCSQCQENFCDKCNSNQSMVGLVHMRKHVTILIPVISHQQVTTSVSPTSSSVPLLDDESVSNIGTSKELSEFDAQNLVRSPSATEQSVLHDPDSEPTAKRRKFEMKM